MGISLQSFEKALSCIEKGTKIILIETLYFYDLYSSVPDMAHSTLLTITGHFFACFC